MKTPAAKEPYDAAASMRRNLEERTGKSFAGWVHVARSLGTDKHSDIVAYLKAEGPMGHGYANAIAHAARSPDTVAEENPVDALFAGARREMRPIYDAIAKTVGTFGRDVEFAPKKGCISLRRAKQFALIEPSTATRIDIGIKLQDTPPTGKLEAAGTWNGMVSHRVRITKLEEFDLAVKGWLKQAYDQAG